MPDAIMSDMQWKEQLLEVMAMARRGRPIGSGLDDTGYLDQISDELDKDPTIAVTTAIKRIGVRDPTTIRRLRDKFSVIGKPQHG